MNANLKPSAYDTDVLIVGAGPTGLALATVLARAGVAHVIVDKLDAIQPTSRAAVIHAHTLEALEGIGAAGALNALGLKLAHFSIRDRDRALVRLRFDELPTPYAHLLMLQQDRTEHVLTDTLTRAGGSVRRRCTVESLSEDADGVTASITTPRGPETVRARYVVGADGMHSIVRQTTGIAFTGSTYEHSFVLADVELDGPIGHDEVLLYFSPNGPLVIAPLPGGAFRVVAMLENAPPAPGIEDVQRLIDERGPSTRSTVRSIQWSSRFRLHHRVADRYRQGRLLLVGDAAHVHSPAGGQGMNTGIVDAIVLGRMLVEVCSGRRNEGFLDDYGAKRRPAAKLVLRLAGGLTAMATVRSAPARWLRNRLLQLLNLLPPARRRLELNLSGIARRSAAELGSV